jgi:hypothetical protein
MTPAKQPKVTLLNSMIILAATSVIGLSTWAYADLRSQIIDSRSELGSKIDAQTKDIAELQTILAVSQEIDKQQIETTQVLKRRCHYHPGGSDAMYSFPEMQK